MPLMRIYRVFFVAIVCVCLAAAAQAASQRQLRAPLISPDGGSFGLNQSVTVTLRSEAGSQIIYTLDGTIPSHGNGIRVERDRVSLLLPPGDTTIRAIAVRAGFDTSPTAKAVFTRQ